MLASTHPTWKSPVGTIYLVMGIAIACPVYILRHRRSEFRLVRHLVLPALGATRPAACQSAGGP